MDILEIIKQESIEKYGPIQECGMYESFCRCYTMEYKQESLEKAEGGIPIEKLNELKKEWEKNKKTSGTFCDLQDD